MSFFPEAPNRTRARDDEGNNNLTDPKRAKNLGGVTSSSSYTRRPIRKTLYEKIVESIKKENAQLTTIISNATSHTITRYNDTALLSNVAPVSTSTFDPRSELVYTTKSERGRTSPIIEAVKTAMVKYKHTGEWIMASDFVELMFNKESVNGMVVGLHKPDFLKKFNQNIRLARYKGIYAEKRFRTPVPENTPNVLLTQLQRVDEYPRGIVKIRVNSNQEEIMSSVRYAPPQDNMIQKIHTAEPDIHTQNIDIPPKENIDLPNSHFSDPRDDMIYAVKARATKKYETIKAIKDFIVTHGLLGKWIVIAELADLMIKGDKKMKHVFIKNLRRSARESRYIRALTREKEFDTPRSANEYGHLLAQRQTIINHRYANSIPQMVLLYNGPL
jgi:hypothetical protein